MCPSLAPAGVLRCQNFLLLQAPELGRSHGGKFTSANPDWASHNLGIFICLNCSGIHRNIPQVSKVKSVRLDDWDDAQVEFMASNGNNVAKAKYESKMPPFYYKPTFLDCQ
uniref:Arf-GAP domain-containing protein n=1 Tax=Nothoprocta perdicaria TaxID=30464 RepID=A0A8C6YTI5_NOTPE